MFYHLKVLEICWNSSAHKSMYRCHQEMPPHKAVSRSARKTRERVSGGRGKRLLLPRFPRLKKQHFNQSLSFSIILTRRPSRRLSDYGLFSGSCLGLRAGIAPRWSTTTWTLARLINFRNLTQNMQILELNRMEGSYTICPQIYYTREPFYWLLWHN